MWLLTGLAVLAGLIVAAVWIQRAVRREDAAENRFDPAAGPRRKFASREIAFPTPKVDPIDVGREELQKVGARGVEADRQTGRIVGEMPVSLRSVGERMVIEVVSAENLTTFTVSSWSRSPVLALDYGKNRRNVDRLTAALRARLSQAS